MSARPSKESTRAAPHLDLDPKYDDYDFPTTSSEPQSGHPGHTTKEQDAKVHQLRAELEKLAYKDRLDTFTLLRFLRARKFDVDLSKQMYATIPPAHRVMRLTSRTGSSKTKNGANPSAPTT